MPKLEDLLIEAADGFAADGRPQDAAPLYRDAYSEIGWTEENLRSLLEVIALGHVAVEDYVAADETYDLILRVSGSSHTDHARALVGIGKMEMAKNQPRTALTAFANARWRIEQVQGSELGEFLLDEISRHEQAATEQVRQTQMRAALEQHLSLY